MKDNEEGEYFIEGSIKLEDDYKYYSNETGVSESIILWKSKK